MKPIPDWPEDERLEAIRRADMALSEAGYPGAIHMQYGWLLRLDVPPILAYRAHQLCLAGTAADVPGQTFAEWQLECIDIDPSWVDYFADHDTPVHAPSKD